MNADAARLAHPVRRRVLGALTAVLVAVGLVGVSAVPANAAGTGSIGGTITGVGSVPLEGVIVQLFYCDPDYNPTTQESCWTLLFGDGTSVTTGVDGTFLLENLEAGDYKVTMAPTGNSVQYAREFWDGQQTLSTATIVPVVDGATSTINPTLELGATISGTVLGEDTVPIVDGRVSLTNTADFSSSSGALVQPDGSYSFQGIPAGEYIMSAGPDFDSPSTLVEEFWNNQPDRDSATRFTLTSGQAFEADFVLATGGIIEGSVVNNSAAALEGIDVTLFEQEPSFGFWQTIDTTTTDPAGDYIFEGIEDGEYIVRFSDFGGTYGQQYFGGADRAGATRLDVGPGVTATNIDAELAEGGTISGTITQTPIGGPTVPSTGFTFVDVLLKGSDGELESTTQGLETDVNGNYSLSGLAPGNYTIQVTKGSEWAWAYLGSVYYPEDASTVSVAAGVTTSDVDQEIVPGTEISGTKTAAGGGPVNDVQFQLLWERTPGNFVTAPAAGGSGDNISYNLGGLPPGNYIALWVDVSGSSDPYTTQYWSNAPTQASATVFGSPDGGQFTGISAVMTKDPWPVPTVSATTAPAAPNGSNDWFTSNVTLTITSGGGTVVEDDIEYKVGTGAWTEYTAPISITTDGDVTYTYRATEAGVGVSDEGTIQIKLDKIAPTVSSSLSGRDVTVTSTDVTSGVALTEYRLGAGAWTTYTGPIAVGNAAVTVSYRATDNAGNVSAVGERDVPAATGTVTLVTATNPAAPNGTNNWFTSSSVTVSATASSEVSDNVTIRSKLAAGMYLEQSSRIVTTQGTTVVTFIANDDLGNQSSEVPETIKIDSVIPTVTATINGESTPGRTLTATATDATSGVFRIQYRILPSSTWLTYSSAVTLTNAAQTVEVRSVDLAGNTSTVRTLDVDPVTGSVSVTVTASPASPNGSNGWYRTTPVTLTGSGSSTLGGAVVVLSRVGSGTYAETAVRTAPQGTTTYSFKAVDETNDIESGETTRTIKLDSVAPSASGSFSGRTFTLTASDATSLVAARQYRVTPSTTWLNYTGPVTFDGSASVTVEYRVTDNAGNQTAGSRTTEGSLPPRVAGTDRFDTANDISVLSYPNGADVVYVTTGLQFPDALAAGPAAAREDAPLLLVAPTLLPDSVRAEIIRLDPAEIVVIGGTPTVSAAVFNQLRTLAPTVTRIAGSDRFETSRLVAERAFEDTGAEFAYIATGLNFPDALAAGGGAGVFDAPVILVNGGATSLDTATRALLDDLGVTQVKVLGGPTSVSTGVLNGLRVIDSSPQRIAGNDRFETARLVNEDAFLGSGPGVGADTVFLATGLNFPDALAGSAWAAKVGAPLYVVRPDCVPGAIVDDITEINPEDLTLLGGTPSLSPAVQNLTRCS